MPNLDDPAQCAAWIHGQPMKPCPRCGGYKMGTQAPRAVTIPRGAGARQILKIWLRAQRENVPLKGPVFMMCRTCGHEGPSVDCTGRMPDDIRGDTKLGAEIKRLWNSQNPVSEQPVRTPDTGEHDGHAC